MSSGSTPPCPSGRYIKANAEKWTIGSSTPPSPVLSFATAENGSSDSDGTEVHSDTSRQSSDAPGYSHERSNSVVTAILDDDSGKDDDGDDGSTYSTGDGGSHDGHTLLSVEKQEEGRSSYSGAGGEEASGIRQRRFMTPNESSDDLYTNHGPETPYDQDAATIIARALCTAVGPCRDHRHSPNKDVLNLIDVVNTTLASERRAREIVEAELESLRVRATAQEHSLEDEIAERSATLETTHEHLKKSLDHLDATTLHLRHSCLINVTFQHQLRDAHTAREELRGRLERECLLNLTAGEAAKARERTVDDLRLRLREQRELLDEKQAVIAGLEAKLARSGSERWLVDAQAKRLRELEASARSLSKENKSLKHTQDGQAQRIREWQGRAAEGREDAEELRERVGLQAQRLETLHAREREIEFLEIDREAQSRRLEELETLVAKLQDTSVKVHPPTESEHIASLQSQISALEGENEGLQSGIDKWFAAFEKEREESDRVDEGVLQDKAAMEAERKAWEVEREEWDELRGRMHQHLRMVRGQRDDALEALERAKEVVVDLEEVMERRERGDVDETMAETGEEEDKPVDADGASQSDGGSGEVGDDI